MAEVVAPVIAVGSGTPSPCVLVEFSIDCGVELAPQPKTTKSGPSLLCLNCVLLCRVPVRQAKTKPG